MPMSGYPTWDELKWINPATNTLPYAIVLLPSNKHIDIRVGVRASYYSFFVEDGHKIRHSANDSLEIIEDVQGTLEACCVYYELLRKYGGNDAK